MSTRSLPFFIVGVERTQELLPELGEETRHKEAVVREGYMGMRRFCHNVLQLRCFAALLLLVGVMFVVEGTS